MEVARAEGAWPPSGKRRIEMSELTSVALASGFAGAFLSWFVIYQNQSLFEMLRQWLPEAAASLTMNAAAGGLTLLAVMAGIRVFYRRQPHSPGLALRTAAWALAGGVLSVIPAVAVAAAMNYPFDATIVGLESVIVASCVIGAIRLGNRLRPFTVISRPQ